MKILEVTNQPAVRCPILKEFKGPWQCKKCDAYGGVQDEPNKPLAVLCKIDQT